MIGINSGCGDMKETENSPLVVHSRRTSLSRWVDLLEKEVQFPEEVGTQTFHCLTQAAYVGVLALTENLQVPLVRQFRPCVETFTLELPGGTVDAGEDPEEAARRELREEAGLEAATLISLGEYYPDTGRLDLPSYGYFTRTTKPTTDFVVESGLELVFVSVNRFQEMIVEGEFKAQLHVALLGAAILRGLWPLK